MEILEILVQKKKKKKKNETQTSLTMQTHF